MCFQVASFPDLARNCTKETVTNYWGKGWGLQNRRGGGQVTVLAMLKGGECFWRGGGGAHKVLRF